MTDIKEYIESIFRGQCNVQNVKNSFVIIKLYLNIDFKCVLYICLLHYYLFK